MVIGHDPFLLDQKSASKSKSLESLNPAPRLDRAAAALVDATIVVTLAKVFAAKAIFTLRVALSFDLDQSLFASIYNILWLTFSVYLIYSALTYRLLGRSVGQAIFSLKTISTLSQKPLDQYTLVLRTFLSFVSLFMVFPIFAVFVNKDGRTFYDKICDTLVITTRTDTKRYNTYIPFDKLIGSSLVLILFVVLSYTSLYFAKNTLKFKADFVKNSKVCRALTDFHQTWVKNKFEESRLDVALALYSAGELSADCLSQEIDFEFSIQNDSPTAFFAKGLISIDSDTKFIKYFKKACEVDAQSSACLVSSLMSFWPNFYEGEPKAVDFTNHPTFVKVWAIKRLHQKGHILQLADVLSEMRVPTGMEGFYAEHLLRAKYFTGEAKNFEGVLKIAENRNLRERNLNEMYCSIAVSEDCQAFESVQSCKSLNITRQTDSHLQNMYYACNGNSRNIFSSDSKHEKYYLKMAKNEKQLLNDLKSIFMDSSASFALRYSSLNTFFNEVTNFDYLASFKEDWESMSSKDFIWRLTGEKLKSKFNSANELQMSFQVFKKLASEFEEINSSPNLLKDLSAEQRFPAQTDSSSAPKPKGQ